MTESSLNFTDDFPNPSHDEWKAEVEKALKGAPFDKKMFTKTYEGITLKPIYTRQDWPSAGDPSGFPGATPFTRGRRASGNRQNNWDVRQCYVEPDPARANDAILNELARGVTSVMIVPDRAARAGLDGDAAAAAGLAGDEGIMIYSADDLDRLLTGVYLDLAPVSLKPGAQFLALAGCLEAVWHRRRVTADKALGAFNADPLGTLATTGTLPTTVDAALAQMAGLAAHTAKTYASVTAVNVDVAPYHNAGATETQDLAAAMATAVAYLKAMTAAGMAIDDACRQILFTFPVGCDQFLSICTLRAARKMWSRVAEACGASEPARAMQMEAVSSRRMMTQRDPWVNMLRTTIAGFAAAVGGADAITLLPHNVALGLPTSLARRVARNTHVVLAEESNLAKVVDAGGGSWYVETRTDELAKAAWAEFQAIEQAGGMTAVLLDGSFAAKIATSYDQREAGLAKRKDPITGVSEFPNIGEEPAEVGTVDMPTLCRQAQDRLQATRQSAKEADTLVSAIAGTSSADVVTAVAKAAAAGATVGQIAQALAGTATQIAALPCHRVAERFEALRDASDASMAKTGSRPKIFLANLGPIAQHTGRATFAKNFFEVAGIEALSNNGFADAASCADAFKQSGASIAILCSADPIYEELVPQVAPALKQAGCTWLFLAGNPGDKKDTYKAAGVDDFVFLGCDLLHITRSTLARLGVIEA